MCFFGQGVFFANLGMGFIVVKNKNIGVFVCFLQLEMRLALFSNAKLVFRTNAIEHYCFCRTTRRTAQGTDLGSLQAIGLLEKQTLMEKHQQKQEKHDI